MITRRTSVAVCLALCLLPIATAAQTPQLSDPQRISREQLLDLMRWVERSGDLQVSPFRFPGDYLGTECILMPAGGDPKLCFRKYKCEGVKRSMTVKIMGGPEITCNYTCSGEPSLGGECECALDTGSDSRCPQ